MVTARAGKRDKAANAGGEDQLQSSMIGHCSVQTARSQAFFAAHKLRRYIVIHIDVGKEHRGAATPEIIFREEIPYRRWDNYLCS